MTRSCSVAAAAAACTRDAITGFPKVILIKDDDNDGNESIRVRLRGVYYKNTYLGNKNIDTRV